jgi:cytoskeletal protein CcmA (bactofilin family)
MFKRGNQQQSGGSATFIATNSEFNGSLHAEGNLRVDGIIHGAVEIRGNIEVSAGGLIEGPEVRGSNIVVHGVIKARVVAEGQLTLSRTARLEGDVVASALNIEAGAFYVGYIEMGDAKVLPGVQVRPELMASRELS